MRRIFFITAFTILFLAPLWLFAQQQQYVPLAPIPGVTDKTTFSEFVQRIVIIALSVGAILAVLMLVVGGFQWMVSEAVGDKTLGRERVKNAILGLLILLASVLILNTINPQLTNVSLLVQPLNLPQIETRSGTPSNPNAPSIRQLDPQVMCSEGEYSRTTGGVVISPTCRLKLESECGRTGQELWTISGYWCNRILPGGQAPIPKDVQDQGNPRIPTADKPFVAQICAGSTVFCASCIRHNQACDRVTLTPEYYRNEAECKARITKDENSNWESNCRAYPLP